MGSPEVIEVPNFHKMTVDQLLEGISGGNMVRSQMNLITKYKKSTDIEKTRTQLNKRLEVYAEQINKFNGQLKSLQDNRSNPAFKDKWKDTEQKISNVKGERFNLLVQVCKLKYKVNLLDLISKEMLKVAIKPVVG